MPQCSLTNWIPQQILQKVFNNTCLFSEQNVFVKSTITCTLCRFRSEKKIVFRKYHIHIFFDIIVFWYVGTIIHPKRHRSKSTSPIFPEYWGIILMNENVNLLRIFPNKLLLQIRYPTSWLVSALHISFISLCVEYVIF